MAPINFLFQIKTELKIFFIIWLCLFFIFTPISVGLYLTPKIERQEAKAWLANIITDSIFEFIDYVWNGILFAWEKIEKWAVAAWSWVKEHIPKVLKEAALAALKTLLHKILAKVTNSIVQWIQNDFHGKPGFITNFDDYLQGAANAAAGKFLQRFFGTRICSPFAVSVKMALSLPVPTFDTRATCTLSDIVGNIEDFYADFTKGGWVAWKSSLEPNNNAFGTMLMALNERAAKEFAAQQEAGAEAPRGFKPTKKCLSATKMTKVPVLNDTKTSVIDMKAGVETVEDPSKIDPDSADCSSAMVTTPDGTVEFTTNFSATSAMRSLEAEMANLMGSGAGATFTPYIMAITNALITKLADKSMTGLLGMVNQGDSKTGAELPTYDPLSDPTLFENQLNGTLNQSNEYEAIINDVAESEKVKANLDSAGINNMADIAKDNYQSIVDKISLVRKKQLSVIVDFWSNGIWGADATATPSATTSIKNESCNASTGTCVEVATAPTSTNMTNYSRTTTTTVTTYAVSHPKIGSTSITKTEISIVDSRDSDYANFDIDGNKINNYNSITTSYSLNSPIDPTDGLYKCQSDYSPSAIICQIDIDNTNPSSDFYESQLNALTSTDIPALVSNTRTALDNFVDAATTYDVEFQKDSSSCIQTGSACATARTSAIASRETVIDSLQTLTGDISSTTIKDLNTSLTKLLQDINSITGNTLVTINNSDGTQTKEDAANYYQDHFNDVVAIYNELAAL